MAHGIEEYHLLAVPVAYPLLRVEIEKVEIK
jgi:hypothetical protein